MNEPSELRILAGEIEGILERLKKSRIPQAGLEGRLLAGDERMRRATTRNKESGAIP
jgi:hypothetical protein